mgnify:CR=1 FL=1|jgi:hypothetical protein
MSETEEAARAVVERTIYDARKKHSAYLQNPAMTHLDLDEARMVGRVAEGIVHDLVERQGIDSGTVNAVGVNALIDPERAVLDGIRAELASWALGQDGPAVALLNTHALDWHTASSSSVADCPVVVVTSGGVERVGAPSSRSRDLGSSGARALMAPSNSERRGLALEEWENGTPGGVMRVEEQWMAAFALYAAFISRFFNHDEIAEGLTWGGFADRFHEAVVEARVPADTTAESVVPPLFLCGTDSSCGCFDVTNHSEDLEHEWCSGVLQCIARAFNRLDDDGRAAAVLDLISGLSTPSSLSVDIMEPYEGKALEIVSSRALAVAKAFYKAGEHQGLPVDMTPNQASSIVEMVLGADSRRWRELAVVTTSDVFEAGPLAKYAGTEGPLILRSIVSAVTHDEARLGQFIRYDDSMEERWIACARLAAREYEDAGGRAPAWSIAKAAYCTTGNYWLFYGTDLICAPWGMARAMVRVLSEDEDMGRGNESLFTAAVLRILSKECAKSGSTYCVMVNSNDYDDYSEAQVIRVAPDSGFELFRGGRGQ